MEKGWKGAGVGSCGVVRDIGLGGGVLGRGGGGFGLEGGDGVGEGGNLCGGCRFVLSKTPFNILHLLSTWACFASISFILDSCLALAVLRSSFSALRVRIFSD